MRHLGARSRGPASWSIAVAAFAFSILATSCGNTPTTPTPAPSLSLLPSSASPITTPAPAATPEDPAAVYARIEQQVQAIRGLDAKTAVTPQVLDTAGVARELGKQFDTSYKPGELAAEQQLDTGLGLLPAGISLRDELFKLLTTQVAGFYEPDSKKMFVVSKTGGIGPTEKLTFAHEYDHALQDQHFDLTKLGTDEVGQSDRAFARLCVAEGDATLLMYDYLQQAFTPAETIGLLQGSLDPAQTAILATMPPYLRDQLLFPYTSGLSFIQSVFANGGWPAVDALYGARPDSTEQILHPALYASHDLPMTVTIPADVASRLGAGWTAPLQDTLGEFTLDEWLKIAGGLAVTVAAGAAAGWGGDRVVVVTGPSGAWGVALVSKWDTPADADEFAAAAGTTAQKLGHADMFRPVAGEVAVVVGSDDDIRARLANVLGFAG